MTEDAITRALAGMSHVSLGLQTVTDIIAERDAEIGRFRDALVPIIAVLRFMDATGRQGQPLCTEDGKPLIQYAELDAIRAAVNEGKACP